MYQPNESGASVMRFDLVSVISSGSKSEVHKCIDRGEEHSHEEGMYGHENGRNQSHQKQGKGLRRNQQPALGWTSQ